MYLATYTPGCGFDPGVRIHVEVWAEPGEEQEAYNE